MSIEHETMRGLEDEQDKLFEPSIWEYCEDCSSRFEDRSLHFGGEFINNLDNNECAPCSGYTPDKKKVP